MTIGSRKIVAQNGPAKPALLTQTAASLLGWALISVVLWCAPISAAQAQDDVDPEKVYQAIFAAQLNPQTGLATATITIEQPRRLVRSIEFFMPSERYRNIGPASRVKIDGDRVTWRPEKLGSEFHFDFVIDHQRSNGATDARITDTWALLKLDYLFPRASARVVKGATSASTMMLAAPDGWAIETPYGKAVDEVLDVSNPERMFDRPLGWVIAGELGVRRDTVEDRTIAVASPVGNGIRANEVLSFLRWNVPALVEVVPQFPPLLLIVSGSDDMWRGGLSGVGSLYLHPDRPMISGNRTSPLLHEVFHVASGLHGKDGGDWIIEGMAEYYSVEILRRSGGISDYRFNSAFEWLEKWSKGTECVATERSQGEVTARAALVMRALDSEIRAATDNEKSLDDLVQVLVRANKSVTNAAFRKAASDLIGGRVNALANCP